ncbi:MAG: UPF0182 family protein [Ardenticatenales bacterium]
MSQSPIDFEELFRQLTTGGGRRRPGGPGGPGQPAAPPGPPTPRTIPWRPIVLAFLVITVIGLVNGGAAFITDAWWFASLGQAAVFRTRVVLPLAVFGGVFAIGLVWLLGNLRLAARGVSAEARFAGQPSAWASRRPVVWGLAGVFGFVALSIASGAATQWPEVLAWQHRTPFGTTEPIFGLDAGFYVFTLPLLRAMQAIAWSWLLAAAAGCGLLYAVGGVLDLRRGKFRMARRARAHVLVLAAGGALLWSLGQWLARFSLLIVDHNPGDSFFGPGYADATARLFGYRVLVVVGIAVAVGLLASIRANRFVWPVGLALAAFGLQALFGGLVPAFVQQYRVLPNELTLERPYIEHNIALTRKAWGIDKVTERPFAPRPRVDRAALDAETATLASVRLWDWRVMKTTIVQLQALRKYYNFLDIDVDRYALDTPAGPMTRETLIAGRELIAEDLPNQTWVNTHLKYTHGYGAVMNPVDEVGPQGRPVLWLRDIPVVARPPFDRPVTEPRIYFGEAGSAPYVVVGTRGGEFDATAPESEERTSRYDGKDGVGIGNRLRRMLFALRFSDVELLLSPEITADSKILLHRNIKERVQALAPFLAFDDDPYLVLTPDGRLTWLLDAYTLTDRFPYSRPEATSLSPTGSANYLRNSVKVVIDAYDGQPTFYVVDDEDPLIKAWRGAFPTLFRPAAEMPPTLREHWRYPEGLFRLQAETYTRYHITQPAEFYNANDVWVIPQETYEQAGNRQVTQPYYVTLKLQGEDKAEFVLMLPFTPRARQNMVGWLAARSDGDGYGQLVVYRFNEGEQFYGPAQIESVIDQDTEISQQLTLWNQSGSQVLRGNLLIVPIDGTLLYVEPVYLASSSGDALPELKRVIVGDNEHVVMRPTLDEALAALVGDAGRPVAGAAEPNAAGATGAGAPGAAGATTSEPSAASSTTTGAASGEPANAPPPPLADLPPDADVPTLAAAAVAHRAAAQAALVGGDWTAFGREMAALQAVLDRLAAATGAALPAPAPPSPLDATPQPNPQAAPPPTPKASAP